MCRPTRQDLAICLGLLCFAALVHIGRIGSSIGGIWLQTDPAMYCSVAAAFGSPEFFARDFSLGLYSNFSSHVIPLVRLTRWLAEHVTDGNYGLAYLQITGPAVFLHYLGFYLLGRLFFGRPWKALLFSAIVSMCYWIPWGTYWGAGYADITPRVLFNGFYALFLCAALLVLEKPRLWPLFMLCLSGTVYVHSISSLPAAAGIWLSFAASRPEGVSWNRHLVRLVLCGLCFIAGMIPFAAGYLYTSGVSLGADDIACMKHMLEMRFSEDYTNYWQGMLRFYRQYTLLPVIPLSLCATWLLLKRGTAWERLLCRHIWLWIAGVYAVAALFVADQVISAALGRVPLEFDFVRAHRFLPFLGMCLIFLAVNLLWRECGDGFRGPVRHKRLARVLCAGVCLGFLLGGLQDMARTSFAWFWNSMDETRYERAYAENLARRDMIEAVRTHTAPNETIFYPGEDQTLRYLALRPLTWCWKDAAYLYHAKNIPALLEWERVLTAVQSSPAAYIEAGLSTHPDYLLSVRPEDRERLVREVGPVVWESDRYILVRNERGN